MIRSVQLADTGSELKHSRPMHTSNSGAWSSGEPIRLYLLVEFYTGFTCCAVRSGYSLPAMHVRQIHFIYFSDDQLSRRSCP